MVSVDERADGLQTPMKKPVWLDSDPGCARSSKLGARRPAQARLQRRQLLRVTRLGNFYEACPACRHDDAMALILAGHSPALHLLGVSTVAGNQTVEKVTDNALRVLAAAGLQHVEVVQGAARPLLRPAPLLCAEIHGESGLDGPLGGPVLPPAPHAALPGKAPVVMFERICAAHRQLAAAGGQQRVHLVATAALTNVALLLAVYPEVKEMIEVGLWVAAGACGWRDGRAAGVDRGWRMSLAVLMPFGGSDLPPRASSGHTASTGGPPCAAGALCS
jgi:inosine-uridine nucleoside N-ribohydrolase